MSDFVPSDMLPDLWEEILKRHWTFLDTEESLQKMEELKKLESCFKEFLSVTRHDRKFFLPETGQVLRKSVREMSEFTAQKAIIGFRAISQYANNLFTKPWRKEFGILKMYSGYFQHEIKSNLLDAEKLFEAMGYRRLSDEVLILDGPICPDQVTNVSRDAMVAYVECQIMKHIYAGLLAMGLSVSWQEIFHYRENYVGGTTQAIKDLAYAIQERRLRKEKLLNIENCYASIQHSPQALQVPPATTQLPTQCANCAAAAYHQQQHQYTSNTCALHALQLTQPMYGNNKLLASYPVSGYHQPSHAHHQHQQYMPQPHMSHSRSLEHYNDQLPASMSMPHRHSFDHQQQGCTAHHYQQPAALAQHLYESPYDCLDGGGSMGSSVSYAAVASSGGANAAYSHPYNISGNRYPLPYNISNQLNSHYATPTAAAAAVASSSSVTCNGVKGAPTENTYATVSKVAHNCSAQFGPPLPPTRGGMAAAKDFRQRTFQADHQLIDFDDQARLTSHDFHAQLHALAQNSSFDEYGGHEVERNYYEQPQRHERRASLANRASAAASYAQPRDFSQLHQGTPTSSSTAQLQSSDDMYGSCVYAQPVPRSSRFKATLSNLTDKHLRNMELLQDTCLDNNRKMQTELKECYVPAGISNGRSRKHAVEREVAADLGYDDADDYVTVGQSEHPQVQLAQRSPTQASKNQDGVGSFESWNYVYQNLERFGYSKDLGERGDMLVQSLDLDSLTLANGSAADGNAASNTVNSNSKTSDKRRLNNGDVKSNARQINGEKSHTLEKISATTAAASAAAEKREVKSAPPAKQEKSILKQQTSSSSSAHVNGIATHTSIGTGTGTGTGTTRKAKSALKSTAATATAEAASNNFNDNNNSEAVMNTSAREKTYARRQLSNNASRKATASGKQPALVATQVIVSSPHEWSCQFCTFLNPDTKQICEMCCRSKGFSMEAAAATVSHTPTCV